jgi:hypothetical protein
MMMIMMIMMMMMMMIIMCSRAHCVSRDVVEEDRHAYGQIAEDRRAARELARQLDLEEDERIAREVCAALRSRHRVRGDSRGRCGRLPVSMQRPAE